MCCKKKIKQLNKTKKLPFIKPKDIMANLNIYLLLIQPFNPKDPIRVLDFIFVNCRLDLT
jgi:hypothetical protein